MTLSLGSLSLASFGHVSPPLRKERPQLCRCLALAYPGIDFGAVEAGGLRKDPRTVFDGPALRIRRRIIEPGDPGMDDCASAHRAGFQRHPQVTIVKSLVAKNLGCAPDRDDFGMGRWVVTIAHRVDTGGDNGTILYHECPDRDFACPFSDHGKIKRFTHKGGKDKAHFLCHSVRPVLTKAAMTIRGAGFPE